MPVQTITATKAGSNFADAFEVRDALISALNTTASSIKDALAQAKDLDDKYTSEHNFDASSQVLTITQTWNEESDRANVMGAITTEMLNTMTEQNWTFTFDPSL